MAPTILGAIAGDVIGSVYEWNNVKTKDFPLFTDKSDFTDDTVLTIAVADCILNKKEYAQTIRDYALRYPNRGYGGRFTQWLADSEMVPYNSLGNGSAMRVSPVGFACLDLRGVYDEAERSAMVTHNHPEGIQGAMAVAGAVFMAKNSGSKQRIRALGKYFDYDMDDTIDNIRINYKFSAACKGSIPQAFTAFVESTDYEDAIRLAISIGGDSDTIACIAGSIACAHYKHIPEYIVEGTRNRLPPEFLAIIDEFDRRFPNISEADSQGVESNRTKKLR